MSLAKIVSVKNNTCHLSALKHIVYKHVHQTAPVNGDLKAGEVGNSVLVWTLKCYGYIVASSKTVKEQVFQESYSPQPHSSVGACFLH